MVLDPEPALEEAIQSWGAIIQTHLYGENLHPYGEEVKFRWLQPILTSSSYAYTQSTKSFITKTGA